MERRPLTSSLVKELFLTIAFLSTFRAASREG
jgi:hypothetical protein